MLQYLTLNLQESFECLGEIGIIVRVLASLLYAINKSIKIEKNDNALFISTANSEYEYLGCNFNTQGNIRDYDNDSRLGKTGGFQYDVG